VNTLWHKIWADLWLNKSRTWLAIINMAVGVFSVGALFGMIDLQLSQMDAAHQRSQPSHINLMLGSSAENSVIEKIKILPQVLGVEALTPLTVRFKLPDEQNWQTGTLIIRADYQAQRYDKTTLETGDWATQGQVTLENLSAQEIPLALNTPIEFETPRGNIFLNLSGVVRHPFVKPPQFGGQIHFFANTSSLEHWGLKENSFRQLLVQINATYSLEKAREVALSIRQELAKQGIFVNATLLQNPQKHWGRPFLAGIHYILQMMAIASLILASALTFKTVSAHIVEQTAQIGVMKALGAKTRTIAYLYLMQILIMAVLAILLALPLGILVAQLSACQLLSLFNIACESEQFSWRAVALMVIGGLITPFFAAIVPIWQGAKMPVQNALATYGLMGKFGLSRMDMAIQKLAAHGLSILQSAALGNLFRSKLRFLLTQSVLICACVTFLLLTSLIASINLTLDNEMARHRYALCLGFSRDQPVDKIQQVIANFSENARVETWRRLPLELIKNTVPLQQKGSLGLQMLAMPSASSLYVPRIESGRGLESRDVGKRVLLISNETAQLNAINVGDKLEIHLGATTEFWEVIGTYRWLSGNNFTVEPVYAPLETVQELTHETNLATFAFIDMPIENIAAETDALRQLKDKFDQQGMSLDVYTTQGKLAQRQFESNQFQSVIGTLIGLASMIVSVGGISLSGAVALNVLQRKSEIGVLRAIGASAKSVLMLFWLEGFFHVICAWLVSVPLAYCLSKPISMQLGFMMLDMKLDFKFDWLSVIECLVGLIVIVCLAAYFPARKASALTVRECLTH
jgi:putative ABC transport system permease protein